MPTITASFRTVAGTQASLGTTGRHSIVADRPEGVAGGLGIGLNGAELLSLAVGGCLCNDIRYAAHAEDVQVGDFTIDVAMHLDGDPIMVVGLDVVVTVDPEHSDLIARAVAKSAIVKAVRGECPVKVTTR